MKDLMWTNNALAAGVWGDEAEAAFVLPGVDSAVLAHGGFSEQSAFTRAFKRWAGETPRAYRMSRRTGS